MNRFSGPQIGELVELLQNNFEPNTFDQFLLSRLDRNRFNITLNDSFTGRLFDVVSRANQELWNIELLQAAVSARPRDLELGQFAEAFIETSAQKNNLEAIRDDAPFWDPESLRARMVEIENRICRVELNDSGVTRPKGTGFLLGPDLVLTNYHVVRKLIDGDWNAGEVRCRFDYKKLVDGNENEGMAVALDAGKPVLSHSKYSTNDTKKTALTEAWGSQELDYALLKLSRKIGEDPPGPSVKPSQDPGDRPRGWESAKQTGESPSPGDSFNLWQHPSGDFIKWTQGRALDPCYNKNGARIRYTNNSLPGSSGSPCFDSHLKWVALHHAGDPEWTEGGPFADYNQGIPAALVIEACTQDGIELP